MTGAEAHAAVMDYLARELPHLHPRTAIASDIVEAVGLSQFNKGDKVVGLGRAGAVWEREPVGTVTGVSDPVVRVWWDAAGLEDDMAPSDLRRWP